MKIKKGYKQTEIGIIPEDWEVKNIEQTCSIKARIGWQGLTKSEYQKSGNYILITGTDFINGTINWNTCSFVSKERFEQDKNIQIKNGDILITKDGIIGKIAFLDKIPKPGSLNSGVFVIRPFKNDINQTFLSYVFKSKYFDEFLKKLIAGSTITHLYQKDFIFFDFPLPNIQEQTAIATVLSDMDEYILSLERLIAKKKAIKQGTMQNLLTGKIRLKGFKGRWVKKKLGEIGIITSSGVDKKIVQGEKSITLLNYLDVYRNTYIERPLLSHVVTASNEKIKNCSVQKDDVFFTPTSETPDDIAKTAVSLETMNDVVYSYHLVRFRPYIDYNGEFIKFACDTNDFAQQAERFADGSGTRYVISIKKFNEMTVFIPPTLTEQTAIAAILSDIDTEISTLEAKRDKYKQVKTGIMQKLLTGQIRLIENTQQTKVVELKLKKINHNDQINEAVVISFLVNKFSTKEFPLSRFRYTKYAYLLHRQAEHVAKGFLKHAGGPYKSENRYKGGEKIALKNGYISKVENPKSGKDAFIINEQIEKALSYFREWYGTNIQEWTEQFRFIKTNIWKC